MGLSTNSIIHYTEYLNDLLKIIQEGFRIKYCAEKLVGETNTASAAAHPMISFCDIPLSQTLTQITAYGKYGIGLSKNWAVKMRINPVLYLEKNSSITDTMSSLLKDRRQKQNNNLSNEQKSNILRIKCFTKNYSGRLERKGVVYENYRFYNEREWRLVPLKSDLGRAPFSVDYTKYVNDKQKYNEKIQNLRYKFDHEDISYIIVAQTNEIPTVIKTIRNHFSTLNNNELALLMSKICSVEQIQADY